MIINLHQNPTPAYAERVLRDAVSRKKFLIILGNCRIEYEGRGASKIGYGDRLIVVKPDGAVLVHRPTGYSPVNWQPDSKVIEVYASGREIILRSVREKPREILSVYLSRIDLIVVVDDMKDTAEFIEYVDEHEIRDYLARHPEEIEPGLRIITVERPVSPGFVDIYARDSDGNIVVIELKRITADRNAVLQLHRYIESFKKHNPNASIRGILVAPSISKNALILLHSLGLEYKPIDIVKIYRKLQMEMKQSGSRTLLSYISKKAGGKAGQAKDTN